MCIRDRFCLEGEWTRRSLVLLGDSTQAKTPVAYALAKVMSLCHATPPERGERYLLSTSQLDSLRFSTNLLHEGVPVVLDEFTMRLARAGRGGRLTEDDIKDLLTVYAPVQVSTRYGDTTLPSAPRLFTSNAATPADWIQGLPEDIEGMSDRNRLLLPAFPKACFKRAAFAVIQTPMVSDDTVKRHWEPALQEASKKARVAWDPMRGSSSAA